MFGFVSWLLLMALCRRLDVMLVYGRNDGVLVGFC